MKSLLIAIPFFILATTAQAYEREPIPDYYSVHYQGTPDYPHNYGTATDIFQGILSDAHDYGFYYRTSYLDHIINHSVIGATFYYKDQVVGEVQNIENTPNLLFTDVDLFITRPATALVYHLIFDTAVPSWDACTPATCHWESSIDPMYTSVSDISLEYWNSAANPIPEPETYAMLLSGLGLLGFVARRKQVANCGRTLALAA